MLLLKLRAAFQVLLQKIPSRSEDVDNSRLNSHKKEFAGPLRKNCPRY